MELVSEFGEAPWRVLAADGAISAIECGFDVAERGVDP